MSLIITAVILTAVFLDYPATGLQTASNKEISVSKPISKSSSLFVRAIWF